MNVAPFWDRYSEIVQEYAPLATVRVSNLNVEDALNQIVTFYANKTISKFFFLEPDG